MALAPQQFCVRWNSYHSNLQTVFPKLLSTENFADVTLACENRQLKCHKVVLSACSAYFERLLVQNPCKHPIIFMKDMRFSEMQSLVDFMYKGEVNVTQDDLPSLLKSAEALQIRGLCSSEASGLAAEPTPTAKGTQTTDGRDYTVATEALLAHAQLNCSSAASSSRQPTSNGLSKKQRRSEEHPEISQPTEVKEETVEEDGLYYGELEQDDIEFNEDEVPGKAGSSLGQPTDADFAIANVQCQYESSSESEEVPRPTIDHNYGARERDPIEPPAFIIKMPVSQQQQLTSGVITTTMQTHNTTNFTQNLVPASLSLTPSLTLPMVNVINVSTNQQQHYLQDMHQMAQQSQDGGLNKRIRRSEVLLKQAADCVSRGHTFQTVSHQFNIPISTIRFFMARKGILPRRRRGRSCQAVSTSPTEPPYHIQHYKLPDMVALRNSDSNDEADKPMP